MTQVPGGGRFPDMKATEQAQRAFSGARMFAARKAKDMTRRALAKALDDTVTERTIARYEAGERGACPDVNMSLRIAKALGVEMEDLLQ